MSTESSQNSNLLNKRTKLRSIRVQPLFLRKPEMMQILPQSNRVINRSESTKKSRRTYKEQLKYFYLKQKYSYENLFKKYGIQEKVDDHELRNFIDQVCEGDRLKILENKEC